MKNSVKIFLVIIGLLGLVGQAANAEAINKEDELKQEIEAIIQKQIPEKKIVAITWEGTKKYSNYVSFVVVTETDKYFEVNVKYSEFNIDQNNYISELNEQRKEIRKEIQNLVKNRKQKFWNEIKRMFSRGIGIVGVVICIVIGVFGTFEFVGYKIEEKKQRKD